MRTTDYVYFSEGANYLKDVRVPPGYKIEFVPIDGGGSTNTFPDGVFTPFIKPIGTPSTASIVLDEDNVNIIPALSINGHPIILTPDGKLDNSMLPGGLVSGVSSIVSNSPELAVAGPDITGEVQLTLTLPTPGGAVTSVVSGSDALTVTTDAGNPGIVTLTLAEGTAAGDIVILDENGKIPTSVLAGAFTSITVGGVKLDGELTLLGNDTINITADAPSKTISVGVNVANVTADLIDIVTANPDELADAVGVTALATRVTTNEGDIDTLTTALDTKVNTTDFTPVKNATDINTAEIAGLNASKANNSDVLDLADRVTVNEDDIDDLESKYTTNLDVEFATQTIKLDGNTVITADKTTGKIDASVLPSLSLTEVVAVTDPALTTKDQIAIAAVAQHAPAELHAGDMVVVSQGVTNPNDLNGEYIVVTQNGETLKTGSDLVQLTTKAIPAAELEPATDTVLGGVYIQNSLTATPADANKTTVTFTVAKTLETAISDVDTDVDTLTTNLTDNYSTTVETQALIDASNTDLLADTITDGVTDKAATPNAVFDFVTTSVDSITHATSTLPTIFGLTKLTDNIDSTATAQDTAVTAKGIADLVLDMQAADAAVEAKIPTVVDVIENNNMNPVTSNAVFDAIDTIPEPVVDQTYNATSTNAQSGVAVAEIAATKADTSVVDTLTDRVDDIETQANNAVLFSEAQTLASGEQKQARENTGNIEKQIQSVNLFDKDQFIIIPPENVCTSAGWVRDDTQQTSRYQGITVIPGTYFITHSPLSADGSAYVEHTSVDGTLNTYLQVSTSDNSFIVAEPGHVSYAILTDLTDEAMITKDSLPNSYVPYINVNAETAPWLTVEADNILDASIPLAKLEEEVASSVKLNEISTKVTTLETAATKTVVFDEPQTLTDVEKEQARENIGAGTLSEIPYATETTIGGVKVKIEGDSATISFADAP